MDEKEIKQVVKENEELKKELALYKKDAVPRGYYVLNKIVNQQIDILSSFNIEGEIIKNPKEDKKYDRVESLWKGLKSMVLDLNTLKIELKLTGKQGEDEGDVPFIETVSQQRK